MVKIMRSNPKYILYSGTLFIFLAAVGVGVLKWNMQADTSVLGIISPLAQEDTRLIEQKSVVDAKNSTDSYPGNSYFPKNLKPLYTDVVDVNAQAFAVMERTSGELLLAKNATWELPIASVVKIMTALVAIEYADLDLELTVSQSAAEVGEAEMGLSAGERLSVEKLLYGLMLPSGNDAAETLAQGLQGNRTSFLFMMNQKSQALGMFDTYYVNPTGLDGDSFEKTSFSTALDQLALTNYALNNPTFAKIVDTYYQEIPYEEHKHKAFYLYNILQLDKSYPGIAGVKPGITDFAGETLVSYAENGGKQIIIVLLGTQNSRDEVIKLYDWAFEKLGVRVR